jgi:hypothetical protein
MRSFALAAAFSLAATFSVHADSTSGKIVAFDRVSAVIVLDDKTVWTIIPADLPLPENLKAGDAITIEFHSNGDNGYDYIISITRTS